MKKTLFENDGESSSSLCNTIYFQFDNNSKRSL